MSDAVYAKIREGVLSGVFEPGKRLYSEELKSELGCGVSPLREALSRLASERLVTRKGQKGFQVAEVSVSEMWEITGVRKLIEVSALQQSIDTGGNDWEERIVASFYSLTTAPALESAPESTAEWERRHRRFHTALVSACPSEWLLHMVELLCDHSERYRRVRLTGMKRPNFTRNALPEHKVLMEVVLDRDRDHASKLLQDHLDKTAVFVSDLMERTLQEIPSA